MEAHFVALVNNLYTVTFVWAGLLVLWCAGLSIFLGRIIAKAEAIKKHKCHGKRMYAAFIMAALLGLTSTILLSPLFRDGLDAIMVINIFLTSSLLTCSHHIYLWWRENNHLYQSLEDDSTLESTDK